jgi:uncharacterized protein YjiS (DUF1127 family)
MSIMVHKEATAVCARMHEAKTKGDVSVDDTRILFGQKVAAGTLKRVLERMIGCSNHMNSAARSCESTERSLNDDFMCNHEMTMRMISSAPAGAQRIARQSWAGRLLATLERWWVAYMTWRFERAAIAQLHSMTDPELKDIGLTRSEITGAVRGGAQRDRTFRRNH